MTLLITSIAPTDLASLQARAERAWAEDAEAVEIRLDAFGDPPETVAAYLRKHPERTWIVTCRGAREGGRSKLNAADRARRLSIATAGTNALVDFEFADWRESEEVRRVLPATSTRRLILSAHDFAGLPTDLSDQAAAMTEDPAAAVVKLAYQTHHAGDTFAALDLLHDRPGLDASGNTRDPSSAASGGAPGLPDLITIAMGEDGLWTRVLAGKLGAFATYCSLDANEATAPGQPTLREMLDLYGWRRINADTRVFGVIGDPVGHSMSPKLFNHWLMETGVNAVYLPILVRGAGDGMGRFLDECRARSWLDLGGFSVTIPHKAAAMNWAGDGAEWLARRIGAANTICFDRDRVRAYNTDCYAAIDSMAAALGGTRIELNGLRVDVLGSGGAAAALVYALPMFGCEVTVFGRSPDRTRRLAEPFGARAAAWNDRTNQRGDVLINCTSVGLWPDADASPMPPDALANRRLVFDVIYNPLETRLLRDAAACGVATLNGLDMFVRQAAVQFELWFGRTPDAAAARRMLEVEIAARSNEGLGATPASRKTSIALIGLRGAGKTSVGRELAATIGGTCVDTDARVVREAGCSIADIFAREGEAGFRERERKAIAELAANPPPVISVGGGAVLDPRNVETLRTIATIVWLTAPPDVLWRRVSGDAASGASRPPLTDLDGPGEMKRLHELRRPLYQQAAEFVIDTANASPREAAAMIVAAIGPGR